MNATQQVTAKRVPSTDTSFKFERPLAVGEGSVTVDGEPVKFSYEMQGSKDAGRSPSSPLKLVLNGAKNLEQGLITGAEAVMDYAMKLFGVDRKSVAVVGLSAVAAVGAASQKAEGAMVANWGVVPASNVLGDAPGNLWVTAQSPWAANPDGSGVFNYNFTAFPVGKQVDQQGNTIKTFLYAPEHALVASSGAVITGVGDGSNYMTNRGREFQNIQIEYRGGFTNEAQWSVPKDIMILSTTTEVPDSWILPLAPEGSDYVGQIVTATGFGRLRVGSALQPKTGDSYGFNGELSTTLTSSFAHDGNYKSIYYSATGSVPVNGRGEDGESGARVSKDSYLAGAVLAKDILGTSDFGYTFIADFTTNIPGGYREQILPYAGIQVVPEPSTLGIVVGGALLLRRQRREK